MSRKRSLERSAPTQEELKLLKESEGDFASNLFRLEIDELLASVVPSNSLKKRLERRVKQLKVALEDCSGTTVTAADVMKRYPSIKIHDKKRTLDFSPPRSVHLIGSYLLDCVIEGGSSNIDIGVEIPPRLITRGIHRNYGYHDIRALYIGALAVHLEQNHGEHVSFGTFAGDSKKPVLILRGSKSRSGFSVRVYPFFFPNSRLDSKKLLPHVANLDAVVGPTPMYNGAIAEDVQLVAHLQALHTAFQDVPSAAAVCCCLKVWLKQRRLFISGFHVEMLVMHLLETNILSPVSPTYTMLKGVLSFLSELDLAGIPPNNSAASAAEKLHKSFQNAFPTVFMDPSGTVNLFSRVSVGSIYEISAHARTALENLANWGGSSNETFHGLFMETAPMEEESDMLIRIQLPDGNDGAPVHIPASLAEHSLSNDADEYAGRVWAQSFRMAQMLRQGLGDRSSLVNLRILHWGCLIGVRLNSEHAWRQLEMGPAANSGKKAREFRQLWGEKAELRRFRDGRILEAVVWECPIAERPMIPQRISRHLLELHFGLTKSDVSFRDQQLAPLLSLSSYPFHVDDLARTAKEAHAIIAEVYEAFRSVLSVISSKLPLQIVNIWPLHPALRGCDVFPPLQCLQSPNLALIPLQVGLEFEHSSQWPEDLDAMQKIKQAFLIQLSRELSPTNSFFEATGMALDVLYRGFVFRLSIYHHREEAHVTPQRARSLQLTYPMLGQHVGTFSGLARRFAVLPETVRLAKRWLNAHLFSGLVRDPFVELTVARVFLKVLPFSGPPTSPLPAFCRWLRLIATWSWEDEILTVPTLGNALSPEQITEAEAEFSKRKGGAPFVVTENDLKSEWTRKTPNGALFARIRRIAACAVKVFEKRDVPLLQMFAHSFSEYNHVVQLNLSAIPTYWQSIAAHLRKRGLPVANEERKVWVAPQWKNLRQVSSRSDLLIGYDPVRSFVRELRDRFGHLALFLYDANGGDRIGIVWKPGDPDVDPPFVVKPAADGSLVFNPDDLLEQLVHMGTGLVAE